ncbi:hypothetical protein [Blautia intestinalis]|uniref:hypothetical protein n=1 Tax=Blautia intestinalis TaxID=2763028 RepID=UPI0022E0F926|nr:hypothetical protein [Blautia intestinalis]
MSKIIIPKDAAWLFQNPEDIAKTMGGILSNIEARDKRIKYLEEENKKLKDEAFKDEELKRMQEKLKRTSDALTNSFQISKKEWDKIHEWKKQHEADVHGLHTLKERISAHGAAGGGYSYEFHPTSIVTFGSVVCDRCGAKFQFQED